MEDHKKDIDGLNGTASPDADMAAESAKTVQGAQGPDAAAPAEAAEAHTKSASGPSELGAEEEQSAATENGARIVARAGEAFDAVSAGRVLYESGLKDPARLEPTDQSFIFAEPDITQADEGNGEVSDAPEVDEGAHTHPAVDLTEPADPDISWRARPLTAGSDPLPTGVLQDYAEEERPRSIYETEPGLFGPGDPWLYEDADGESEPTELVLGVKFREYGSVYFFRAGKEQLKAGGKVLVETEHGLSLGEVISARRMRLPLPKIRTGEGEEIEIKPILSLPGPEDIAAAADNKILAAGARLFCKECIRERKLDMKLVDVEVLHDRSKIIFYFTAPSRIDFRELVKDLVRNYRTRIELRQIGVRHETQMLGALGNCDMACCCRRYLRRFAPVTIKMAKEQNLFLNPAKLSGICGRLLCCLANEQENYEEFHRNCPKIGKKYQTTRGVMRVLRANLFRQSIMAVGESGPEEEFLLEDWNALEPERLELRESRDGAEQNDSKHAENETAPFIEEASEEELAELMDDENDGDGGSKKKRAGRQPRNQRNERDNAPGRGRDNKGKRTARDNREGQERRDKRGRRDEQENREPRESQVNRNARESAEDDSKRPHQGGQPQRNEFEGNISSGRSAKKEQDANGQSKGSAKAEGNNVPSSAAGASKSSTGKAPSTTSQEAPVKTENSKDDIDDAADKSIFGLPGSRYSKK